MPSTAGASRGEPVSDPRRISVRTESEKHRSCRGGNGRSSALAPAITRKGKTPAPSVLATNAVLAVAYDPIDRWPLATLIMLSKRRAPAPSVMACRSIPCPESGELRTPFDSLRTLHAGRPLTQCRRSRRCRAITRAERRIIRAAARPVGDCYACFCFPRVSRRAWATKPLAASPR